MRINKYLHDTDRLDSIGLIEFCFGGLLKKAITAHIIYFFSFGAVGKYFKESLEQVLSIEVVMQVICAIRIFIIYILEQRSGFEIRHYIFVDDLCLCIFLFCIILLSHAELILRIRAFQYFIDSLATGSQ